MKKLTIVSLFFLSVQLFAQVNSTEKSSLLQLRNFEHSNFSFEEKSKDSLPPVSTGKVFAEFFGGNLIGYGLMFPSLLLSAGIISLGGENNKWTSATGALTFILSYPFAIAYGVYVVGNIGDVEGSYWSTFLGTLGGIGVSVGVGMLSKKSENYHGVNVFTLLFPSVGAIIGFNSSRRLETNTYSFKVEQNKYSILKPDYSIQLLRVNF